MVTPPFGSAPLALTGVVSDDSGVRAVFAGEVDMSTSPAFAAAITDVLHAHPGHRLSVDLAGIRFLDSSGIRTLLICQRRAREQGGELVVVDAQPAVLQVLEITGVLGLLTDGQDSDGDGGEGGPGQRLTEPARPPQTPAPGDGRAGATPGRRTAPAS